MSEALADVREGFSKKEIKMAIGVASDPRYKQGNYSGAVRAIEKIKKGLSTHPQVAAVLKRQNEEIFEKVKCPHCEGDGCPKCEGNGYMADAVDKEDEPFLKDLIKNLRKGSATHSKQADDLEKAVKEETELDEKVGYVYYKFKSEIDAKNAKRYFDGIQLMGFDINDDDIRNGFLIVDAGKKDMTKYHKEVMKKFKPHVFAQEELDEDKSSTVYDFDRLIKDGGLDKRDFRKAKNLYVSGKLMDLRKHIYNLDTSPLEAIMDVIAKNDPKAFMKMYPKSKKGEYMSSIAYAHKEEVELDEAKEVLSRFKDDKLKKSIMNLATQKGLKVKEMGDKLEVSGNARKVMDLTLAVQKHDVKIEHNMMSAYTAAITKGVK